VLNIVRVKTSYASCLGDITNIALLCKEQTDLTIYQKRNLHLHPYLISDLVNKTILLKQYL